MRLVRVFALGVGAGYLMWSERGRDLRQKAMETWHHQQAEASNREVMESWTPTSAYVPNDTTPTTPMTMAR
jgi:hypothetical protein